MNINPCLLIPENWVISFHRKTLLSIIVIEIFFIFSLRIISFCCKLRQSSSGESQFKKEEKLAKIEVIQKSNIQDKSAMLFSMQGSHLFFTSRNKLNNKNKPKELIMKKQASQILSENVKKQDSIIQLKNLIVNERDMTYVMCVELGHQFICIGLAVMYYPFATITLICLAQLLLLMTHYILSIIGVKKLAKITKAVLFFLNIAILVLSIYGLCTNVPQPKSHSCFDL